MTTLQTIEKFTEVSKDAIAKVCYGDAWRSTSYLIQLLNKLEGYYESLNEQHPDEDYYTAQVAITSALELISGSYKVPVKDERFEEVSQLCECTYQLFITEFSDDALADLIYISGVANWVASMRTHNWNQYIEQVGPSESSFRALKLAKRDEKAVELAVKMTAEVLFPSDDN